jgi:hypothetical protein
VLSFHLSKRTLRLPVFNAIQLSCIDETRLFLPAFFNYYSMSLRSTNSQVICKANFLHYIHHNETQCRRKYKIDVLISTCELITEPAESSRLCNDSPNYRSPTCLPSQVSSTCASLESRLRPYVPWKGLVEIASGNPGWMTTIDDLR